MSLGALAFLNPWLLTGLIALPAIWWLLRTVPPRPQRIDFPPTRILVDIENRDSTPAKTPWWLMLIRLLAAAAIIFALAEPVLNPERGNAVSGSGPVVLIVDNGWASAAHWPIKRATIDRLIDDAERAQRAVMIVPTAWASKSIGVKIEAPADARSSAAAIEPLPFAPDRSRVAKAVQGALAQQKEISILWLADGIDHDGDAKGFADALISIANGGASSGSVTVIDAGADDSALGLRAGLGENGKLVASVLRGSGAARQGLIYAFSARGQRLSEAGFSLAPGPGTAKVTFDMPLELRNQVTRLAIAGEPSAGAVSLLDARSQWHRIGLVSGGSREESQPLLAPLYYIKKALRPYAELVPSQNSNVAEAIENIFKRRSSVLMLADIGTITGELAEKVEDWVKRGGILVRFAGPRLEKGGDDLLPVPLRVGGRSLGGALSWTTPQPLAAFADNTPFAGLAVPADVLIRRQVLADPTRTPRDVKIWARLKDGTPLVTAKRLGEGEIILFHVTANSNWSNLPLSGLFVEMLRRLTALGHLGGPTNAESGTTTAADPSADAGAGAVSGAKDVSAATSKVLAPVEVLSGFGVLKSPPPTAEAIEEAKIFTTKPSAAHPPGYYGPAGAPRALNVIGAKTVLKPLPALPGSITRRIMETMQATSLKHWLLSAALALLFADVIAILLLQAGGNLLARRARATAAGIVPFLALVAGLATAAAVFPADAMAQGTVPPDGRLKPGALQDKFVIRATGKVTFGYVLTGDDSADQVSRLGLMGLAMNLRRRTAVDPGDPAGINMLTDEIALFPIIYWPVLANAKPLPDKTLAKIDAYMKQGGMIIFDTRDFGQGLPTGFAMSRGGGSPLQRLLGKLDIPRLEPVPQGHVLTKSFYLLSTFPGRWGGGELWVEADAGGSTDGSRQARRADGVSSILVTSNDFASAWAVDERGRPLFPTVPGGNRQRELAVRTGINIAMYALTGNYKADQVHIPALLERLGQ